MLHSLSEKRTAYSYEQSAHHAGCLEFGWNSLFANYTVGIIWTSLCERRRVCFAAWAEVEQQGPPLQGFMDSGRLSTTQHCLPDRLDSLNAELDYESHPLRSAATPSSGLPASIGTVTSAANDSVSLVPVTMTAQETRLLPPAQLLAGTLERRFGSGLGAANGTRPDGILKTQMPASDDGSRSQRSNKSVVWQDKADDAMRQVPWNSEDSAHPRVSPLEPGTLSRTAMETQAHPVSLPDQVPTALVPCLEGISSRAPVGTQEHVGHASGLENKFPQRPAASATQMYIPDTQMHAMNAVLDGATAPQHGAMAAGPEHKVHAVATSVGLKSNADQSYTMYPSAHSGIIHDQPCGTQHSAVQHTGGTPMEFSQSTLDDDIATGRLGWPFRQKTIRPQIKKQGAR
jgi:hypothetical protein